MTRTFDLDWLVLAYTLPPEPSRKRVAVWRRLRKLGAVYVNEGFWFLPNQAELAQSLDDVVDEVYQFGGTASAFVASDLRPEQHERLRERFTKARDEEYRELRQECQRFKSHVGLEMKRGNFRFVEVEELEQDLEKRVRWLAEIVARDFFGSTEREEIERLLHECRESLASFTEAAYEQSNNAEGASTDAGAIALIEDAESAS